MSTITVTALLAAALLLAPGDPARAEEAAPPPPAEAQEPADPDARARAASPPEGPPAPALPDGDRPPPQPAPLPPPPRPGWIDETHALVEQELGGLTRWVDRFFLDERDADPERASTDLRWRNELRLDDRKRVAARTRLRASLDLPGLERWLARASLVFTGESLADPNGGLSDEPVGGGLTPTLRAEQASLDLRFQLFRRASTIVDAGPGVGLRWPAEGHLAARMRQRVSPGLGFAARLTQVLFYSTRDRFGGTTDLDVDRRLAAHLLARWRNRGLLSEVSRGLEWGTELGLAYDLQPLRLGLYLAGAVSGATRPVNDVIVYRVFTRVRRDVWRRWLFLELEPEVLWPTSPPLGRHKEHAVTLRLEVAFGGKPPEPVQPSTP